MLSLLTYYYYNYECLKYRPTSPAERTTPTSDRVGDVPQQSNNQPQISRLDQNPFIRMQADGNLGSQSSNSMNHLKGGAGFSAGLSSSTGVD
ncbi:unnamed protein product [Dibothriocephalus latus]|uniref:Uncharacterized protein n=1 Tax=Dibothriocephalus latus TaxID=60516 RepID=A0A3P7LJN5_DIBLA|nr:unnamed protein product [Dibothriocephalus latus]